MFFFYICVDLLQLTSVWSINIICFAEAYLTLYCRSAISPRVSCEGLAVVSDRILLPVICLPLVFCQVF